MKNLTLISMLLMAGVGSVYAATPSIGELEHNIPGFFDDLPLQVKQWYVTDKKKPINMYDALKKFEDISGVPLQNPTSYVKKTIDVRTKAPVEKAYIGIRKIYNTTESTRYRSFVGWEKVIIRFHSDKTITGWICSDENGEWKHKPSTFNEDLTNIFIGSESKDTIEFQLVKKDGWPSDDVKESVELKWNNDGAMLVGTWALTYYGKKNVGTYHVMLIPMLLPQKAQEQADKTQPEPVPSKQ